jgi:glycosyltransferase involved in cell wall biosynthesis
MKEVVSRPRIYRFWKRIEKFTVPKYIHGYTVNDLIAAEFRRLYRVNYEAIRNLPLFDPDTWSGYSQASQNGRYIIYQGAVNEGRSFETLIPAMKMVDARLVICGDGNFMEEAKELSRINGVEHKITFTGWLAPDELKKYTHEAYIGVNILENKGLNHHFSLSNRFFDYIQSALPQVCVDYPAYCQINDEYHCALMISDTSPLTIAESLNLLLTNKSLYDDLKNNCIKAKQFLNWNNEEMKLQDFYKNIFGE